ncbi:MAG: MFS transporter [Actinocatenispora sp.]
METRPPAWALIGPALAGLVAVGLSTAPLGRTWHAIEGALGLAPARMLMFVLIYPVVAAATSIIGVLLGRRSPNAVGIPAIVLMVVGLALTTLTPTPAVLLAGRAVTGLGAGAVVGTVVAIALHQGRQRGRALAIVAGVAAFALVAGLFFGWVGSTMLNWRWVFLAALPVTLLALFATIVAGIVVLTQRAGRPAPPAPMGR